VTYNSKGTSLLYYRINYSRKKFYDTDSCPLSEKVEQAWDVQKTYQRKTLNETYNNFLITGLKDA
jgi:hypothetical protein